jgi:hypothetical protein
MSSKLKGAVALAACLHAALFGLPAYAQPQPVPIPIQPQPGPQPPQPVQGMPQQGGQPVPGGDTVYLNNGGVVKGTLVELAADHATVQLPTGQLAIVQARDIHHIERQTMQPGIRPGPAVFPQPAQAASVLVHIDSPQEVNLMRKSGKNYDIVCTSPCDAMVPVGETYRISGSGVTSSADFHFGSAGPGQRIVLHVDPGSTGTRAGGWVIFGIGTATLVAGLTVMLIGALQNTVSNALSGSRGSGGAPLVAAGAALSLAGVAGLVVGIVMAVGSKTKTQQETQQAAKADDRWLRVPAWAETAKTGSPRDDAPRAWSIPVLGGTF